MESPNVGDRHIASRTLERINFTSKVQAKSVRNGSNTSSPAPNLRLSAAPFLTFPPSFVVFAPVFGWGAEIRFIT